MEVIAWWRSLSADTRGGVLLAAGLGAGVAVVLNVTYHCASAALRRDLEELERENAAFMARCTESGRKPFDCELLWRQNR